jgi:hypothetical protein
MEDGCYRAIVDGDTAVLDERIRSKLGQGIRNPRGAHPVSESFWHTSLDRIDSDDAREPDHPGGIDLLLTWLGIVGPRKARSKFGDRINRTTDYFPRQLRSCLPAGAKLSSCWINKQDLLHCVSGGANRICTRLAVADCKLPQAARGDHATANRWVDRPSAFCQTRCRVDGDRAGPMARWYYLAVAPEYRCGFAGRAKWRDASRSAISALPGV